MPRPAKSLPRLVQLIVLTTLLPLAATAQPLNEALISADAAEGWIAWQSALSATLQRDTGAAEDAFAELEVRDIAPLRLALFAERTTKRTTLGGALLLLEQADAADELDGAAQAIYDALEVGREQLNQANDGWYFASLGRFDVSRANFAALIDAEPDPVALLELADRFAARHAILVQLSSHPEMGESVRAILDILAEGERRLKSDPIRIRSNIARLSGPPRAVENAVGLLKDSGEYAVPFLLEALSDPAQGHLRQIIVRTLARLDREALNPLIAGLDLPDDTVRIEIIRALAEIGYPQALPYLVDLSRDSSEATALRDAAALALQTLARRGVVPRQDLSVAEGYYALAELFYNDRDQVAADPRLATANVWSAQRSILTDTAVPTEIFNEVTCMRLCETVLRLDPNHRDALSLWIAANFRRAQQLGDREDATRPDGFESPQFYARAAGATYVQAALARGLRDADKPVIIGSIQALGGTAGASTLVGGTTGRAPLADALLFPDRMVRIQAALTLANSLPTEPFRGEQHLFPTLVETVGLYRGARNALVVEADQAVAAELSEALSTAGYSVTVSPTLPAGLDAIRNQGGGLDVVLMGTNVASPGFAQSLDLLQGDLRFGGTPVVAVTREADRESIRDLTRLDSRVSRFDVGGSSEQLVEAMSSVFESSGTVPIAPHIGLALAKQALQLSNHYAVSEHRLFEASTIAPTLIEILQSEGEDPVLLMLAGSVLSHIDREDAQRAIFEFAIANRSGMDLQLAGLQALASSAKRYGNQLTETQAEALLDLVREPSTVAEIRFAASQALGALSLPVEPVRELILAPLQAGS